MTSDGKPLPPYPLFRGWPKGSQAKNISRHEGIASFQPSAISAYTDAATRKQHLFVLNDFFDPTQYHFEVSPELTLKRVPHHARAVMQLEGSDQPFTPKFEGISRLNNGQFLANSPFGFSPLEAYRRIFLLDVEKATARVVPFDVKALGAYVQKITGQPWFQIEGLALDAENKNVFLGVRFVGQSREGDKRAVVLLVRCPWDGETLGAPMGHVQFSTVETIGREEGLAEIQLDPTDGSYVMLTSYEGDDELSLTNMGGHLWRLPASALTAEEGPVRALAAPLARLRAKGEGVTVLSDRKIVVVFDDDNWKENFHGYPAAAAEYMIYESDGRPALLQGGSESLQSESC